MSFLNDTKNFGLVIAVLGLFEVISAVIGFVNSVSLGAAGALIAGLLVLLAGFGIYKKSLPAFMTKLFPEGIDSKFGVLTGMMFTVSVAQIIACILAFNIGGLVAPIILMILALVITNDKKNAFDKIIWILLVIIAVIAALTGFMGLFAISGNGILEIAAVALTAVARALMYFMLLFYLLDSGVKKKFGM